MPIFMITFGIATKLGLAEAADEDAAARTRAIYSAAFRMGPAWTGGQRAVFVQADLTIDNVTARLTPLVSDSDNLLVVEIGSPLAVRYAGWLVEAEDFAALFPEAIEAPA